MQFHFNLIVFHAVSIIVKYSNLTRGLIKDMLFIGCSLFFYSDRILNKAHEHILL